MASQILGSISRAFFKWSCLKASAFLICVSCIFYCIFFKIKFGEFADSTYILEAKFNPVLKVILLLFFLSISITNIFAQAVRADEKTKRYSISYQNLMFIDSGRNYNRMQKRRTGSITGPWK